MISKIISGGQTGVDTAVLDAAIKFNIPYGGWCPQGRICESGVISNKFSELKEVTGIFESEQENYNKRTELNIRDSDGTLVLVPKMPVPNNIKDGTILTINQISDRPHLIIDLSLSDDENITLIIEWLKRYDIKIVNIGGPRESSWPGIYKTSLTFFQKLFLTVKKLEY